MKGIADIHAHTAMNTYFWRRRIDRHWFAAPWWFPPASLSDLEMLRRGDVRIVWSVLHVPEREFLAFWPLRAMAWLMRRNLLTKGAWECLVEMHDIVADQVESIDDFAIVTSNAELDAALEAGKRAIVHTVEGGHVLGDRLADDDLEGRLERLDILAQWGVASLVIAHLFKRELAGHVEAIPDRFRRIARYRTGVEPERGLSDMGAAVVERMVQLRMIPDVTHCTPTARRQIYDLVDNRVPVVASHVGVAPLNAVPYNLTEQDVVAIAASQGVIGVIFASDWLHADRHRNGLDDVWATMKQVHDWTDTWRHVAIGTDFDGFTDPPNDLNGAAKLPRVAERLVQEGLSGSDQQAVLIDNARDVLSAAWQ